MKALKTHMQNSGFTDLTKKDIRFPKNYLESQGYKYQSNLWDNGRLFHSLDLDSGFTIHVVDFEEVWLERLGKLTPVQNVLNSSDLMDLERLLG